MHTSSKRVGITRRDMLRMAGLATLGGAGSLLAACGAPAPPGPAVGPTSSAPAPAQAVQAAATPATAPAAGAAGQPQPTAAVQAPAKPGRNLIGQLEGPVVVTDAAQMPKT